MSAQQGGSTPRAKRSTPKKQLPVPSDLDPQLVAKAGRIADQLAQLYPDPPIPLDHEGPFQLLVAVMLSAQTTDKKVNEITPALFKLAPDATSLAAQQVSAVQAIIQPIGLAPTKARNLVAMAQLLLERHGGSVPASFEELEVLPGVGHKTASVVMAQAFGRPALPVDTHIHRLAARWGLSSGRSVEQTEADLKALLPQHTWRDVHLQIIYFGREHCPAKQHDPGACPICSWAAAGDGSAAAPSSAGKGKGAAKRKASTLAATATATAAAVADAAAAVTVAAAAAAAAEATAAQAPQGAAAKARRRRRA